MITPEAARGILKRIDEGEPLRLFLGRFPHMSEIVITPGAAAQLRDRIVDEMTLIAGGEDPAPAAPASAASAAAGDAA